MSTQDFLLSVTYCYISYIYKNSDNTPIRTVFDYIEQMWNTSDEHAYKILQLLHLLVYNMYAQSKDVTNLLF